MAALVAGIFMIVGVRLVVNGTAVYDDWRVRSLGGCLIAFAVNLAAR